ncbi:MAG: DMT family transporter [Proteobacteria bacterium]|nr:DMT family transporter [Pseudomonadota bacterium]
MSHPSHRKNYFRQGVLPILVAAALWAVGYYLRKSLLKSVPPLVLIFLISTIVAVFIFLVYRLDAKHLWDRFKAHKYKLIGLSLSGAFVGSTLMLIGLDHLDLGVATLLEKLQPLFTLGMAAVFLNEKLAWKLVPYGVLAVIASYFISVPHPFDGEILKADFVGIAAIAGAAFCWGISSVLGRFLVKAKVFSAELAFMRFAVAAVVALPCMFLVQGPALSLHFTPTAWLMIFVAAMGCTGYGYVLYYNGLKWVDAPTAGFLELVTPAVSLFLGIVFLQERLSLSQWMAVPVMLFSVYRITAARPAPPPVKETS